MLSKRWYRNETTPILGIVSIMLIGAVLLSVDFDPSGKTIFGQLFELVGAVISTLALVAFLHALELQREALSVQKQELQATRDELQKSVAAQQESQKALASQAEYAAFGYRLNALTKALEMVEGLVQRKLADLDDPAQADARMIHAQQLEKLRERRTLLVMQVEALVASVSDQEGLDKLF